MDQPLVTVICLCYNHARFVQEAIQSVLNQTYGFVELIVVDDASNDKSADMILHLVKQNPSIQFIALDTNQGNCKAFNIALSQAKGEYIIDLAADDILLPGRIESGVTLFTELGDDYGVIFSDAEWIQEDGSHRYFHSQRFPHHSIPQSDVYRSLIDRYFICSPSMIFRRSVIDQLGGYDESLTYEDFDFWIRSSRNFKYAYTPEVLVKKRMVRHSMSEKQFQFFSRQSESTYRVCKKIRTLNRTKEESSALVRRVKYEMKQSLKQLNFWVMLKYFFLLIRSVK